MRTKVRTKRDRFADWLEWHSVRVGDWIGFGPAWQVYPVLVTLWIALAAAVGWAVARLVVWSGAWGWV